MRNIPPILLSVALLAPSVHASELPAVVHKPTADVYAEPRLDAPKVATLQRDTAVKIADMTTRNAQFNASATLTAAEKNQQADLTIRDDRLKALLGELQSLAQMATALFNNLHVSSSTSYAVSGNDGT